MIFNFPRTRFVDGGGIINQIDHVYTEITEALEAALTPDNEHTAEELMDVIHSAETALRIMQEKHGVNLNEVRRNVERKNFDRNYYA